MQIHRPLSLILSGLVLTLAVACGGGSNVPPAASTPTPAKGLAYTDPVGTGWRLVKDASSTPNRLILNLVGPSGYRTRGVGFNLSAPATVKFGTFTNGLPINDLNVYQLRRTGSTDPVEPVAFTGGVKPGNILSVGIYQKDRDQAAQDSGAALCQIALSLDTAQAPASGTAISLNVLKAKAIPEDIGRETDDMWTLDKKMRMADLAIAVGTLSAQ
jgi:hypothetical protein